MAPDEAAGQAGPDAFGVLGPLEVLRSGRAVPLGGPRQRAVLGVLLLQANRVVSVDRLVEDVWEGHAPGGLGHQLADVRVPPSPRTGTPAGPVAARARSWPPGTAATCCR